MQWIAFATMIAGALPGCSSDDDDEDTTGGMMGGGGSGGGGGGEGLPANATAAIETYSQVVLASYQDSLADAQEMDAALKERESNAHVPGATELTWHDNLFHVPPFDLFAFTNHAHERLSRFGLVRPHSHEPQLQGDRKALGLDLGYTSCVRRTGLAR